MKFQPFSTQFCLGKLVNSLVKVVDKMRVNNTKKYGEKLREIFMPLKAAWKLAYRGIELKMVKLT